MAKNTVSVTQVVNDFVLTLGHDDYVNDASDTIIRQLALRGVRDMGFDMLNRIKSVKLAVDSSNKTVALPEDFVSLVKVGVVGTDGLVYVFGDNKNINYSMKADSNDLLVDSKTSNASLGGATNDGVGSYVFNNYYYSNNEGQLYGYGGGKYSGQYRVNLDQNRIEVDSRYSEVVLEYVADEARSANPTIHIQAEEALRSYIYYRLIERKASVPSNEKSRARQEYYNELRKANARLKSFSKEEALKTIRKNYKLSPKG
jgi:hypothetical protein